MSNIPKEYVQVAKEAYREVMVANHPGVGGNHYIASNINEEKGVLLGKRKVVGRHTETQ